MRVLITNNTLAMRAGSELYVRDVALGLLKRGHTPIAYSTELGEVAQEIRNATVPVIDDLDALSAPPDVIHGQHHLDTMTALLRFPGVPAIYFCHGWAPWEESPPRFPRILRYLAVDELCRERLIFEHAIPDERIRLLLNFVDLDRFKPRGSLPNSPRHAVIFSNYTSEYTQILREVCAKLGITLDLLGLGSGNQSACPENVLINYDLVFARGRSALEALAVGAAVILFGRDGAGPMVTTGEFSRLRSLNFGARALSCPITVETLESQIIRYNAHDAAEVSRMVRACAGRDEAVDQMISLYREVIAENKTTGQSDTDEESRAASAYLRRLASRVKAVSGFEDRAVQAELARNHAVTERDCLQTRLVEQEQAAKASQARALETELGRDQTAVERENLRAQLVEREQTLSALSTTVEAISLKASATESQLQRITNSLGWRLLSYYGPIKYRFVQPAYESLRRTLNPKARAPAIRGGQRVDSQPHNGAWAVSRVQARAKEMVLQHGFLGVPVETFDQGGRRQLIALLREGLNPESKVLEIGCGCLRVGCWLIRFLDPGCYHGIEPARQRVEYGLRYLLEPGEVKLKQPRFDYNADFDSSSFNSQFDFFLAGSIWTHASKRQIQTTLDSFVRDSTPTSVFLTSYLPARSSDEDYQGEQWVGTSHESGTPGVIRHSLSWIEGRCQERGLRVEEYGEAFDSQTWLRIQRD